MDTNARAAVALTYPGLLASAGLTLCGCGGVYRTAEVRAAVAPGGAHYHDGKPTAVLTCGHTVAIAADGGEGMCACIDALATREPEDAP